MWPHSLFAVVLSERPLRGPKRLLSKPNPTRRRVQFDLKESKAVRFNAEAHAEVSTTKPKRTD